MRLFIALIATVFGLSAAQSQELTVVYSDPAHHQTSWFTVAEWPSFVFAPGAPLTVAAQLRPRGGSTTTVVYGGSDIDCDQVAGPVYVGSYDPNRLDGDGDGIGCE